MVDRSAGPGTCRALQCRLGWQAGQAADVAGQLPRLCAMAAQRVAWAGIRTATGLLATKAARPAVRGAADGPPAPAPAEPEGRVLPDRNSSGSNRDARAARPRL